MIDSKKLIGIFLLVTITNGGAVLVMLNTIFQPFPSKAQNRSPSPQISPQKSAWKTLWEMVESRLNPQQLNTISRGPNWCLIAPGQLGKKSLIWNKRPMFFWRNSTNLSEPEFRIYSPLNSEPEQKVLWRKTITQESSSSEFQAVQYQGETLKNNQNYKWQYFAPNENTKKEEGTFKLLSVEAEQSIAQDLKVLEIQLHGKTAEEIILKRFQYFADKELWSDALQELFSVNKPSADFVSQRQHLLEIICSQHQ